MIIGGSTLDEVLSAEARLYEAEAREIKLLTEKYKSQLAIATSLGLLSNSWVSEAKLVSLSDSNGIDALGSQKL